MDVIWNANYWSERLEENRKEVDPILRKMQSAAHSTKTLTVEEQYKLQDCLIQYASYSRLLRDDLDQHAAKPPVPFWKKLFWK